MSSLKKITVCIDEGLLKKAQQATGQGITATVVKGIHLLTMSLAYKNLLRLKGKYKFSINLNKLRKDR